MAVTANARLAGVAYLVYIAAGIASMAVPPESRGIFNAITSFCALALGVTLYALTRDVDLDLALIPVALAWLGFASSVGLVALLAVQLTLGTTTNWSSPVT